MASGHFSSLLRSRLYPSLLRRAAPTIHSHLSRPMYPNTSTTVSIIRQLATSSSRRSPPRPSTKVDIGARARQIQSRRLWTYALTFSCVAGFIVIVLNNFQDALVFYITPSEALDKYIANPTRNRFRLGGLVLEGSISHPSGKSEMEFVITDLLTEILVKYEGEVPDLFREGHSVVAEGFVREFEGEEDRGRGGDQEGRVAKVTSKARSGECYFKAVEVLAKHDEKYMPREVAEALDRNKKKIEADQDIALHCGNMLRECIKYPRITRCILELPSLGLFFKYVELPNFDIASDALATFKDLFTKHEAEVSQFLTNHYLQFFEHYEKLLSSTNYVTRRQSLKLLLDILLEPSNAQVLKRFILETEFLKIIMTLLKDSSKNIQLSAFDIFKVFVANPNKSSEIISILTRNHEILLLLLRNLPAGKAEDDEFEEERELIIQKIEALRSSDGST